MQMPFDFVLEASIAIHVNQALGGRFTAPQDVLTRGWRQEWTVGYRPIADLEPISGRSWKRSAPTALPLL